MQVGDLVIMPGSIEPATGIVLKEETPECASYLGDARYHDTDDPRLNRVKVYWFEDAEAAWEPKDWLEVISEKV
jgi:hypothetical protein